MLGQFIKECEHVLLNSPRLLLSGELSEIDICNFLDVKYF